MAAAFGKHIMILGAVTRTCLLSTSFCLFDRTPDRAATGLGMLGDSACVAAVTPTKTIGEDYR